MSADIYHGKNNPLKQITVNTFTDAGIIGPSQTMLGSVGDGGIIEVCTAPGCWGLMITPKFKGGHEVTRLVAVAGAKVGDAIALKIKSIRVASLATASGTHSPVEGRYTGDPFVARKCSPYITHAKGSRKWDVDGNEYIDYVMGHGALILGHCQSRYIWHSSQYPLWQMTGLNGQQDLN